MPYESAVELAARVRRCEVSCVELVQAHLDRIDEVNPVLNAVVARDDERSLAVAARADAALAVGEEIGPLHGVPITLKDSIETADLPTTAGTEGWRDHRPAGDATVVARLRAAGAILIGKTNTPELTFGIGTTNEVHGRTNNPYDPRRSPSGSSGGAAAILAAGGSALDIGSDTGGSVREPAHACGISALKPTNGRVPLTGHAVPRAFGAVGSLTTLGPMARWVGDLALAHQLLSGPDGLDFSVPPVPVDDPIDECAGLRAFWYVDNGEVAAEPPVAGAVRDAAEVLADRGTTVAEGMPGPLVGARELYERLLTTGASSRIRRILDRLGTTTPGPGLGERIDGAQTRSAGDLDAILEEVDLFRGAMQACVTDLDVLLCPVTPSPALLHEDMEGDNYLLWGFEAVFNLCGWPVVVVRAGTSPEGLPIGVQIAAPPWREDIALGVAAVVEADLGGFVAPSP